VGEVLGDARTLAQGTDTKDAAVDLVQEASARIDRIRLLTRGARRPRVAALEWLDPPFAAGHWTPQLIEYAGGEDILGFAGENSAQRSWEEDAASRHHRVDRHAVRRSRTRSPPRGRDCIAAGRARGGEVVAVDAAAYFSRPGPRIIEGLELLAHILHPELVPDPPAGAEALPVQL
jgi:iron complex transport system substrate-binding protein